MHKNTQHLHGGLRSVRGRCGNRVIGSVRLLHQSHSRRRSARHDRPGHAVLHAGHIRRKPIRRWPAPRHRRQRRPRQRIGRHRGLSSARAIPRHDQSRRAAAGRAAPPAPTGQFVPPSAYANPQATVNASISSDPTPGHHRRRRTARSFSAATGTTARRNRSDRRSPASPHSDHGVTATPTTAAITTTPTGANTTALRPPPRSPRRPVSLLPVRR